MATEALYAHVQSEVANALTVLRTELQQSLQEVATVTKCTWGKDSLRWRRARRENVTAKRETKSLPVFGEKHGPVYADWCFDVYTAMEQVCEEVNLITRWVDSLDTLGEITEANFLAWVRTKGQNVLDMQWGSETALLRLERTPSSSSRRRTPNSTRRIMASANGFSWSSSTSLTEMEELRKFKSSTFDTLARRKLIEDQNTVMELSGRVQELQNEVNCMNDSKDFQDAESVLSGNSHVTSQPMSFPAHPIPEGDVEAFFRIAAPQRRAAMHMGYTWYIRKRFCKSTCIFISSFSSRIKPMGYNHWRAAPFIHSGEKWKTRTKSRS